MSELYTEKPIDTRITLPGEKPRRWSLNWLWRIGNGIGIVLALLALGISIGFLPRWEAEAAPQPDLIRPVDLPALFAEAGREAPGRAWPADERELPFEAPVKQLLANVRHATGREGIGLPVAFDTANLTRAPTIDIDHADGAILIGQESVRVAFANHCLIICPGVVHVSHSYHNVILAGQVIDVSHDGGLVGGLVGAPDRSVLVCPRRVRISHARDTVCLAPDVEVSHAHRMTFIHRQTGRESHAWWCREVRTVPLIQPIPPQADPLADEVAFLGLKMSSVNPPHARLHVKATGAEVALEKGKPAREGILAGWRLVFSTDRVALLHDGKRWSLLTHSSRGPNAVKPVEAKP